MKKRKTDHNLTFSLFITGAKPFDCPQCEKSFRTSAHRKSHITSHFRDGDMDKRPKRMFRRANKQDLVPDIPLQEPILITDTGRYTSAINVWKLICRI